MAVVAMPLLSLFRPPTCPSCRIPLGRHVVQVECVFFILEED